MRVRIKPLSSTIVAMLLLGAISLAASIIYNSSILAFIGLGLVFWGAVLLYIRPEEYTRKTLLEAALSPPLTTLNQMIQKLDYKGDATYLPPKYFTNPETTKVCISRTQTCKPPNTRTNATIRKPTHRPSRTWPANHTAGRSIVRTVGKISRNKLPQNRPQKSAAETSKTLH